ncbi:MAG: hypothetical protein Aureis2KO_14020 [Aureisphaera sp.]
MAPSKKLALLLLPLIGFTSFSLAQDAKGLVIQQVQQVGLNVNPNEVVVTRDVVSKVSGVRHIYYQQVILDIPVLQTESSLHVAKNGDVLKSQNRFIVEAKNRISGLSNGLLEPEDALNGILKGIGFSNLGAHKRMDQTSEDRNEVHFSHGGIFERDIQMFMRFVPWKENIVPIWQAYVFEKDYAHFWEIWYHATEGKLLKKEDQISFCDISHCAGTSNLNSNPFELPDIHTENNESVGSCENCYEVFELPVENPFYGSRTAAENPHDPIASPFGWHDLDGIPGDETQVTWGNNVFSIEADDNYGYQPSGGSNLDFSGFPFSTTFSEEDQFEDAAVTNVFYTCNMTHDILYRYGFDEPSGNFQFDNYGNGGVGEDPVITHVQSNIRPCNAFMVTPLEGSSPTLVISTCNSRDGSYDNLVLVHEYAHGLTNRMTFGNGNLNHEESPSEGWSDWFGMMLTMQEGDTALTRRTIANYLRDQSPTGPGVREYPYTMDLDENPLTFEYLEEGMTSHMVGNIWATILWELTWKLIDTYGFDNEVSNFTGDVNQDAGNIMALAIVIEGLRYTTAITGFVEARDGILIAAETIYGLEMQCLVWEAFTARGLGVFAESGNPFELGDESPSYDFSQLEPRFDLALEGLCNTSEKLIMLSGGHPRGGEYFGPGVVDVGNGTNFSFDPTIAGPGNHEITYYMQETPCFEAAQISIEVQVSEDTEPPIVSCIHEDETITYPSGEAYEIPNYLFNVYMLDECSGTQFANVSQSPVAGTMVTEGEVQVTLAVEDLAGNTSYCNFLLTLEEGPNLNGRDLAVSPVPAINSISLGNPFKYRIRQYELWDFAGRRIIFGAPDNREQYINIPIDNIASGIYFLKVGYQLDATVTFRIVKE